MSRIIFQDPALQQAFETEGYVQFPLLQATDIERLSEIYHHYFPHPPEGFYSSSYLDDFALKKEISEAAAAIIRPRIAAHFQNHRVFGSAFLAKTPGKRSEMPMHQDWSIVDEREYVAVNIWTPLQDANRENGSLEVLRGSHAFAPVLRAPTIPFFWEEYTSEMLPALTPLSVRAGEAVVLNQALVHYSPPMRTPGLRIAITTGLLSGSAPMRFHYQTRPGEVEVFEMDDDFLLQFSDFHSAIYERPDFGRSIVLMPYQQPQRSRAEVLDFIRKAAPMVAAAPAAGAGGIWAKIKGWLG